MRTKFTAVALALTTLIAVGCANTRFNLAGDISPAAVPKYEETQTYFLSGIGQSKTIDAARICGGAEKVAATAKEHTFLDGLLAVVTFGIYTPETARVYCK